MELSKRMRSTGRIIVRDFGPFTNSSGSDPVAVCSPMSVAGERSWKLLADSFDKLADLPDSLDSNVSDAEFRAIVICVRWVVTPVGY